MPDSICNVHQTIGQRNRRAARPRPPMSNPPWSHAEPAVNGGRLLRLKEAC